MNHFGDTLKAARLEHGLTQQELASLVGVTTVCVGNWERGARKPTMDALCEISRALAVSVDSLLSLQAPWNTSSLSGQEETLLRNYRNLDAHGRRMVDTVCSLEVERAAGSEKPSRKTVLQFPVKTRERLIPRYTSSPSAAGANAPLDGAEFEMIVADESVPMDADYAIYVSGRSMEPYIHDGDMVYVDKDAELSVGDVGIFCVDGALYCKQYYRDNEDNLVLASANPELRDTNIVIPPDSGQAVNVCGKVLLGKRIGLPGYLTEE